MRARRRRPTFPHRRPPALGVGGTIGSAAIGAAALARAPRPSRAREEIPPTAIGVAPVPRAPTGLERPDGADRRTGGADEEASR